MRSKKRKLVSVDEAKAIIKILRWANYQEMSALYGHVCIECGAEATYFKCENDRDIPSKYCFSCKKRLGIKAKLIWKTELERAEKRKEMNRLRQKKFREKQK